MYTSRPIEIEGRFLGVAVADAATLPWRFIATHPAVGDLDGARFPSPAEATRVAGLMAARSHRPAEPR